MKKEKIFFRLSKPWTWPWMLIYKFTYPVPPGLWLLNGFVQRILRINSSFPLMLHFTSRATGNISIGQNVWKSFVFSENCYIQGANGINIGDDTVFAPGVKIISANHDINDIAKWKKCEPINIGKRCWIGANAIILPGVQLGDGVVVGAGCVVTKSFPSGVVLAGVPAKIIKTKER